MEYRTKKTDRKIDIRPQRRIEEERHRKAVSARFLALKEKTVEGTSDWRIMEVMAGELGCTAQNVRNLLLKEGTVKVRRKVAKRERTR